MKTLVSILSIFFFSVSIAQSNPTNGPILSSDLTIEDEVMLLQWSTKTESNTSYFAIELSNDGESFDVVNSLKAKGYSYLESNYELELEMPSDSSFIRIVLVNMEGKRVATSETFNFLNNNLIVCGE